MTDRGLAIGVVMVAATGACVGNIGDGSPGGADPATQGMCADGSVRVAPAPLRRLTSREYDHVVRDVFGDDSAPGRAFVDESVAGFASNAVAPITVEQLMQYRDAAEAVAANAVANALPGWVDCDVAETACVAPLLSSLAKRAFRRPADAETESALVDLYESGRESWGAAKGVELALQGILMAPQFLYHVEGTR
ncbi:MAG TPA: DUF1595 domain-containing protein, partial [Gemmatimonadales bacterium]|nr:DUF1595 domain-containing protein [Gemmatimonadales bacterium]